MLHRDKQKLANGTQYLTLGIGYLGTFYMHYHIYMIKYGMAFVEPVGGTGWLEQVSDTHLVSELSTWIKGKGTKLARNIKCPIAHANTYMLTLILFPTQE